MGSKEKFKLSEDVEDCWVGAWVARGRYTGTGDGRIIRFIAATQKTKWLLQKTCTELQKTALGSPLTQPVTRKHFGDALDEFPPAVVVTARHCGPVQGWNDTKRNRRRENLW